MPHRHHKPGARIFVRSTSFCSRRAVRDARASLRDAATEKLLRKKENESWTMRRFENIRRLTSPTLGVGGNLLCKIVQFVFFGSRYSSSRLYSVSRRRLRRPLRRVTQRQSQWLCQQRVSIFRSINRQQRSQSFHRKTSSRSKFNA